MNPSNPRPMHQPETEFIGLFQEFSGEALSPDDASLEPRERKGRPADRQPPDSSDEERPAK